MPVVTNQQTLSAAEVLDALVKVKRPMCGTMKMRRITRLLNAHLGDYDTQRQALLQEHGDHDEDGNLKEEHGQVVFADDAARAAFAQVFGELLLVTFEVPEALVAKDFGPLTEDGTDWLHEEQAPTPEQAIALGALFEDTDLPSIGFGAGPGVGLTPPTSAAPVAPKMAAPAIAAMVTGGQIPTPRWAAQRAEEAK